MRHVIQRFKKMPTDLAVLSGFFMFLGPLLVFLAIIPIGGWTYKDEPISYAEFWRCGAGLLVTVSGTIMAIIGWSLYRAYKWARYVFPIGFLILTLYLVIDAESRLSYQWIGSLIWAGVCFWYFFSKKSVTHYFYEKNIAEPIAAANRSPATGSR